MVHSTRAGHCILRIFGWTATGCLLFPVLFCAWVSFSPDRLFSAPITNWSLRWYCEFFQDARWISAAVRSVAVAMIAAIISVGAAAPVAWRLAQRNVALSDRRGNWLHGFILLPVCVPVAALGAGLLPLMSLSGLAGTLISTVLVHTTIGLPIALLIVRSQVSASVVELCSAARGLGGSRAQVIRRVTLPLLSPALAVALIAVFVISLNESVISVFLATPANETLPAVVWPQLRFNASPLVAVASCVTAGVGSIGVFAAVLVMRGGD